MSKLLVTLYSLNNFKDNNNLSDEFILDIRLISSHSKLTETKLKSSMVEIPIPNHPGFDDGIFFPMSNTL